jgi:apolipoprotein N-acyltransferase
MLARLGLNVRGVIDVELPAAAAPTMYTSLGDWTFLLLWAAVAAAAILGRRRNPTSAAPG